MKADHFRRYVVNPEFCGRKSRATSLVTEHPNVGRRIIVCLEDRVRRTEDGIDILPAETFAARLWKAN